MPVVGYENLDSKNLPQPGGSYYDRIDDADVMYLGASAKYMFNNELFAKAGPIIYAAGGNEDVIGLGIGGAVEAGYNLNFTDHSSLELGLSTTVINIKDAGKGTTPFAGIKIGYVFNFQKLK